MPVSKEDALRELARRELERRYKQKEQQSQSVAMLEPVSSEAGGSLDALFASGGKFVDDLGSNLRQVSAQIGGDSVSVAKERAYQAEADRLFEPTRQEYPTASFLGNIFPAFAVPGRPVAQGLAGATEGALEGDTTQERITRGGVGFIAGLLGQRAGDWLGSRTQNVAQRALGNPNAGARGALLDAGVPLTLSQRTDGPVSGPMARFFERAQFLTTGNQPLAAEQQQALTGLVTEALGVNANKLTREGLGVADRNIEQTFRTAAKRAGPSISPDAKMVQESNAIIAEFNRVGSDSAQVERIFRDFEDFVTSGGRDTDIFLKLRSDLSKATTKSDLETSAIVRAIDAMDDRLARQAPDVADELKVARERFRLMLALRRGSSLSPQGDINIQTFTKNLESIFKDFDVGSPLPGGLAGMGEAVAGYNQIFDPFRSSGTAENLAAGFLPIRLLSGGAMALRGGGSGGLMGGGAARGSVSPLMEFLLNATYGQGKAEPQSDPQTTRPR